MPNVGREESKTDERAKIGSKVQGYRVYWQGVGTRGWGPGGGEELA